MCNYLYNKFSLIASCLTILVDTREHRNEAYEKRIDHIIKMDGFHMAVKRRKLDVGDYSAVAYLDNGITIDFSEMIAIERKADLEEFLGNISGKDRARFENELKRAKDKNCKLIIAIESGSYDDLVNGRYLNPISVKSAIGTFHTFEQRYGVEFVFVTPDSFPGFVNNTMRRFAMEYLCEHFPHGIL